MRLHETLLTMNTRQVAGSIVRDEIARQGFTHKSAADAMRMARSTLVRVLEGGETVSDLTLRQVEGPLHLPRRFLTYVIDGDRARIERLDMDADLRRHALDALADMGETASDTKRQGA